MPKFIFGLVLFLTSVLTILATDLRSNALPTPTIIAQRITSPGLTTPIPTQVPAPILVPSPSTTPTSTPIPTPSEPQIPIPVPPPKNPGTTNPPPTTPPPTSTPTPTPPQFPTNHSGRTLAPSERDRIVAYLRSRNISTMSTNPQPDARFILHDTSVIFPPSAIERERRAGKGSLGLGVNAYLPRANAAVLARPNFYESRRPTTTEFEKASDILNQTDRERLMRRVWQSATGDARRQALDTALANLNLSSSEVATEQREASAKLSAASGKIFTTATWSIEAICTRYNNGDRSVIASGREDGLRSACGTLTNYFNIRESRVKSSVAAEIIQAGVRSERGNQNTCDARNSNIATFPNPPYSDNQYNYALGFYLRAVVGAGKFPQLTTHFALDTFDPQAHCDPRCFNLTKLYSSIAAVMGHAQGSMYGITPSYGPKLGTNNIWWNDRLCHGSAP